MSLTWRLVVLHADGSSHVYQAESDVLRLDSFDVTPAGDCGEALLTVLGSSVVLPPRAIVTLETSPDGSVWTPRYRGLVVVAASTRTLQPQTVKLVGLRQRFYELTVEAARVSGGDVAAMAHEVLDALTLPFSLSLPASFPDTGFQFGDRFPQLETVGAFLDALVEAVPQFVVPVGGSYTYDGVTYGEGEVVPGVEWGVDAAGLVFFRRPASSGVSVSESDAGVGVSWGQVNAESVVNAVRLVYGGPPTINSLSRYQALNQLDGLGLSRTVSRLRGCRRTRSLSNRLRERRVMRPCACSGTHSKRCSRWRRQAFRAGIFDAHKRR